MRKITVSFALWYLRVLAKIQLLKVRPTIVGVGGASGKTSLSNFISLILSQKFKILETKGKNSETGIPLSILGIKLEDYNYFEWTKAFFLAFFKVIFDWEKYDILIAEMGIDGPFEPKNMSYLLKIVKPRIGVLTNISFEHSIYFEEISKDKERILELTAKQEGMLLQSLPQNGFAVVNLDDPFIGKLRLKCSKITVSSKDKSADFFIEKIETELHKFKVQFLFRNKKYEIKPPTALPKHYALSIVLSIAVCERLGVDVESSINILEKNFSIPPGRMSIFEGKNNTTIIDSSYNNATLQPILDILELLNKVAGKRRKVAVIGDMRELGIISQQYHEKVAKKILETTDLVFLIGTLSRKFIAPILRRNKHKFYSFNTFSESMEAIKKSVEKGDIVLVKSSQNTLFLERVVEMLLKNKSDVQRLARRGKFWDRIRSQTP